MKPDTRNLQNSIIPLLISWLIIVLPLLDRAKEDWVKAIKEDGLNWTQVSDLKFWQSDAAKTYNVTSIPFSLLLDKNGVIIAKNLRGAALEAKLSEIFFHQD